MASSFLSHTVFDPESLWAEMKGSSNAVNVMQSIWPRDMCSYPVYMMSFLILQGLMLQDLISAHLISDYTVVELPGSVNDLEGTRRVRIARYRNYFPLFLTVLFSLTRGQWHFLQRKNKILKTALRPKFMDYLNPLLSALPCCCSTEECWWWVNHFILKLLVLKC